jgi:hypothetical protein
MGRKVVIIDPIPEGEWYLGHEGTAMVRKNLPLSSIHIVDEDRTIKRWVRDPDQDGQAVVDDVSVVEYLRIGYAG